MFLALSLFQRVVIILHRFDALSQTIFLEAGKVLAALLKYH